MKLAGNDKRHDDHKPTPSFAAPIVPTSLQEPEYCKDDARDATRKDAGTTTPSVAMPMSGRRRKKPNEAKRRIRSPYDTTLATPF